MPTHEEFVQFLREFRALPLDQQRQFLIAMRHMVEDLRAKRAFRPGLRISGERRILAALKRVRDDSLPISNWP